MHAFVLGLLYKTLFTKYMVTDKKETFRRKKYTRIGLYSPEQKA